MINSMTAFARCTQQTPCGSVTIELRSVNHRYLELTMRLPDNCRALELPVRELIRKELQRGKVDCILTLQINELAVTNVEVNLPLLKQLSKTLSEIQQVIEQNTQVDVIRLLQWPGVMQAEPINLEQIHQDIIDMVKLALRQLVEMRKREGQMLYQFLLERLACMQEIILRIEQQQGSLIDRQRHKIMSKLNELQVELDKARFEQELIFFLQKIDITEELERLKAHIQEVHSTLKTKEAVGRRLDFLMQELNRESNTIGSKSTDAEISHEVVELKVIIEQMREQIQNIE